MNKKIVGISVILLIVIVIALTIYFSKKSENNNINDTNNSNIEQINNEDMEDIENTNVNNNLEQQVNSNESNNQEVSNIQENTREDTKMENNTTNNNSKIRIKAIVNGQTLYATLENNSTTRDFVAKLPITLPMMDLYGREMCYRFDEALSTDNLQSNSYEIGEIAYWAPRHSFVILYEQNGERFERQTLGKFDSSVDIFKTTGDANVTFELAD